MVKCRCEQNSSADTADGQLCIGEIVRTPEKQLKFKSTGLISDENEDQLYQSMSDHHTTEVLLIRSLTLQPHPHSSYVGTCACKVIMHA